MKQFLSKLSHKRSLLLLFLFVLVSSFLFANFNYLVHASFGSWGDSSLIHACKNPRNGIAIVGTGDSCDTGESQITWLKDADAGTGLTASRDSNGVTLSLADSNNSGWFPSGET